MKNLIPSFLLASLVIIGCKMKQSAILKLVTLKALPYYSSGSAIESDSDHIYVMGDDATYLLVLNHSLEKIDSIHIFDYNDRRIPKDRKPDLESATFVTINNKPKLLLVGSGSLHPTRDVAYLVNVHEKRFLEIGLDSFYKRLEETGIKEMNIEGVTTIGNEILMVNRGDNGHRKNQFIFTSNDFFIDQTNAPIFISELGGQNDSSAFHGISGLDYSSESDRLFLTVSTEATSNNYSDGAIGKSYLWVINKFSSIKKTEGINPNEVFDLEQFDSRFKGHKIESATILSENDKETTLVLVSDDDDGSSTLFVIVLSK